MTTARRSRQLLLPLATLLAAGAIAFASSASFTSSSATAASTYATGTLSQSNSREGQAVFSGANLVPGTTVTGSVTITNTGSLPAAFHLRELAPTNDFTVPSRLQLTVTEGGQQLFAGTFGTLDPVALGEFAPGESRTYTFATTLAADAPNAEQGRSASAVFAVPELLGFQTYAITTGSMTGTADAGALVIAEQVPVDDLAVGDVITYVPPAESGLTQPVTGGVAGTPLRRYVG